MCVCAHVCACECTHVCRHILVCVPVDVHACGVLRLMPGIILYSSSKLLKIDTASLTSQLAPEILCLHLLRLELQVGQHTLLTFLWVLGTQTPVLMPVW